MSLAQKIESAKSLIESAEYIIIGAGAGLSEASGVCMGGKKFQENFQDFISKYHIEDLYSGGFYPYKSEEEKWAFWALNYKTLVFDQPSTDLYKKLYQLVSSKNYFVITTNVDEQFRKSGFDENKLFACQGSYSFIQCKDRYHNQIFNESEQFIEMSHQIQDCKIPSHLVPKCPICGGKVQMWLRSDEKFVEDDYWHAASKRYHDFKKQAEKGKTVLLEFGVGFNTPGIIRFPFEQMVYNFPNITLIRFNRDNPKGPMENADKTISFTEDIYEVIKQLL